MSNKPFARTFPSDRIEATTANTPRRTTHGSCAWVLPSSYRLMRQPQDGAIANAAAGTPVSAIDSHNSGEAEDARLSGSLRSLARRVRGLNVMHMRPVDATLSLAESVARKAFDTKRNSLPAATNRSQVA